MTRLQERARAKHKDAVEKHRQVRTANDARRTAKECTHACLSVQRADQLAASEALREAKRLVAQVQHYHQPIRDVAGVVLRQAQTFSLFCQDKIGEGYSPFTTYLFQNEYENGRNELTARLQEFVRP